MAVIKTLFSGASWPEMRAIFRRLEDSGVTLNFEKCEFAKSSITYLGHVVSADGIRADPSKVRAIKQTQPPKDVGDIRRFLCMANQLGKLIPNLSTVAQPLRDLLQKKNQWTWGPSHQRAFDLVKDELSKTPVLALYDPNRETTVSVDASSYGLGAVLRQRTDGTLRPVAYASRAMTPTEQQYFPFEKEPLAITWSLSLREVLSRRDGQQTAGLATQFKEELRLTIATHSTISNAFDAIHVHDHSCTRKEPRYSRRPVARSLRATSDRSRSAIDGRSDGTSKPGCGCVTCNREEPGRNQSSTTRIRRVSTGHALLCGGLAQPPILAIGIEAVLASAERFDYPERATPQGGQARNPNMHACGWQCWTSCMKAIRVLSGVVPGLIRPSDGPESVGNWSSWCAVERCNPSEPMIASETALIPWQKFGTEMFVYKKATYLLVVDYANSYVDIAKLTETTSPDVILHLR